MFFSIMSGGSMHSVLVGLVCLAIASAISCSSVGSSNNIMCLESERHALLQFKQGLVDKSNALASWKSEKDCCKWRGIACNNQTGHVTSLDFSFSYDPYLNSIEVPFRGEISHSLLELPYLNYLDLSYNDFEGTMIPKFIGSLSQLKELKLAGANFRGPVPPQLGNLSNLHTLDLYGNQVVSSENLEWLSHLSSLRYLNMSQLNLSEAVNWPESLSKLTLLTELELFMCDLPDVNLRSLSFINSSTSLQLLDLCYNSLNSSIFYWIANVSSKFIHIGLQGDQLQGPIPDVFKSMLSLASLDLSFNQLEGGIPKSFQNLCSLESLTLRSNQLSENIEDSIKNLSCAKNTLETLDLIGNLFWGSLPDLARFSMLRELNLAANQLNGSLPESVGQLSSLEVLSLVQNSLSGVITEAHFLKLSRLQSLAISNNHFSIN
ncbi:putative non-specific serine/threonine protein kinase [Rosa chinensis]|uniref:Putative non-specific serine/threonine protein kinase n=1 Tax=Rosa chinensis TaxID=74649 RepID=A0A2P6P9H6_ROSCH|nr:putative non-specific serine/threonine protein kinase [Rosa chinensis]